jgi:hypothetical protein
MYHYFVGIDLGKAQDYTALAVIEEPLWLGSEVAWDAYNVFWPDSVDSFAGGWVSPSLLSPRYAHNALSVNYNYGRPAHPPLHLRHLERFELGTKYDEMVGRVKRLLLREPIRSRLRHTAVLVDKTGPGESAVDFLDAAGIPSIPIGIHGGSRVIPQNPPRRGFNVPKKDFAFATQVLLQTGRLQIAEGLELAPVLKRELLNFRVKTNPQTAHESFEHWREGDHDDLVLATAMAAWYQRFVNVEAEKRNVRQGRFKDRTFRQSDYEFSSDFSSGRSSWLIDADPRW